MAARLVIVESPAKAKTIGKYLGKGYTVRASYGHVRDLPKSKLGVDVDQEFQPQYLIPRDKKQVVKGLKEEVKSADEILLATDPDREGEAIAWHLVSATGLEGTTKKVRRVVFHEITKDAVKDAIKHPRAIDMNLVNAQQARRILDRLVGYKISPILWKKVKRGLSAGRVQSVALRLIVDREREVERFEAVEYWTLEAQFEVETVGRGAKRLVRFDTNLHSINGKRAELKNEAETQAILQDLTDSQYVVGEVRQTRSQRKPAAPFTTSTLQQEASRKLNFTSRRTMSVAQQLYEGVDLGKEGSQGLITYMRTDSTNVATVAQDEARQLIATRYGAEYVPETPPVYTKKAKNAQEAHEAVRPTSIVREPEAIKDFLTPEQFKLYRLVWQRFVASQMSPAQLDNTSVDILADGAGEAAPTTGTTKRKAQIINRKAYLFRATGSVINFAGFLAVYQEGLDEGSEDELSKKALPLLKTGDQPDLIKLSPEQHFTQPPPRFTEATLVKTLEELGIGRPSTYAPTLGTIQERYYVVKEEKKFVPTELGLLVNDLVVEFFPNIVDTSFTSNMENELDEVADGTRNWVPVLSEFYDPFKFSVEKAETEMQKVSLEPELAGEDCEKCGRPMYVKLGKFGRFIACSGFPECRNAKPILKRIGMVCPKCNEGEVVMRNTRKRRVFFGCSRYPECDFSVWERPLLEPCPQCSGLMTLSGKRNAKCTVCGHIMPYEVPDADEQPTRPAVSVVAPRSLLSQATAETVSTHDLQEEQAEDAALVEQLVADEAEEEERQVAAV